MWFEGREGDRAGSEGHHGSHTQGLGSRSPRVQDLDARLTQHSFVSSLREVIDREGPRRCIFQVSRVEDGYGG